MSELPQINLVESLKIIGPQLHLILWGLALICFDFLIPAGRKSWAAVGALAGLTAASVHLYLAWGLTIRSGFFRMITLDPFATFFSALFLVAAILTVIMSYRYLEIENEQHSEYYALILFATAGMMFMAGAVDLVTIFVGLELMSISTYILVGLLRTHKKSNEAALKYFLLGAFSTGMLLYGMSLIYGITGSTNLSAIARQMPSVENSTLVGLALMSMMAALCFKVAAAPFHMWVPDAYEGAPTAVTAFMSVAVKAAAFAIFFRIFEVAFFEVRPLYVVGLSVIAMVTMTWGNFAAVTQSNVKRLLAYSSISHAGYVLMGLVAGTQFGISAAAIYLLAYTFMNLGIWAVVIVLRRKDIPGEEIENFNGLFFSHPWIAVLALLFLLSLTGIPPLAGFIAKYFVFAAVMQVALQPGSPYASILTLLAIVGALNAVVSLFYYLRIVLAMFMNRESVPVPLGFSTGVVLALVVTGALTIGMGIFPNPFIELARAVSLPLL